MTSIQSHMVRLLLRLIRRREKYAGEAALKAHIRKARRRGPAMPTRAMRRRLSIDSFTTDGQPVFSIGPKPLSKRPLRHILYLHGGAYVFDIVKEHWQFLGRLAQRLPCTITVPLYPLAPEATCRQVFDWLLPIYKDLTVRHPPGDLVIMGDSAGAGMGLALAQILGEKGLPQPGDVVLISPWLDVTMTNPDIAMAAGRDPMLRAPGLVAAGRCYAGDLPVDHAMVSPINGSLQGLAPITVFMGTDDILHPDARRLKALADMGGAALDYHETDGMFHVWMLLALPESRLPMAQLKAVLRRTHG